MWRSQKSCNLAVCSGGQTSDTRSQTPEDVCIWCLELHLRRSERLVAEDVWIVETMKKRGDISILNV